ncbi:MAG: class I SAM-dependent methyltransferase [bacterium]
MNYPRINYYDDGARYDVDYRSRTNDIDFYVQRCVSANTDVLELGCGTGRISIPIAQKGLHVTGIDSSAEMLKRAKEKLLANSELKERLEFIRADFTDFDLGKKFQTVIMPFNALQHLYDLKSINQFFFCLKEHIEDNGLFIFDVINPDLYELSRNSSDWALYDSFHDELGRLMVIEDSIDYDPVTQIANYVLSYSLENTELFELSLRHRMFFTQELEEILYSNGFHIQESFGDFDQSPLSSGSPSQIFVCMYKN